MTEREKTNEILGCYYKEHREQLTAFVLNRVGDEEESRDIVQDIFLRLLCSDKMISTVTLPCLVYTMARNIISDRWRHRLTVEQYERKVKMSSKGQGIPESTVYAPSELLEVLERGMARLTARQRTVYSMNIDAGLRVSEISERLGANYKSVERQLGLARKEVRRYVGKMLA